MQKRRNQFSVLQLTCPFRLPSLSIQRKRDDDGPLMITWPGLTDFSCSKPENTEIVIIKIRFLHRPQIIHCLLWMEVSAKYAICCELILLILTVRCLSITSCDSPIHVHLQIHPTSVVICKKKQ